MTSLGEVLSLLGKSTAAIQNVEPGYDWFMITAYTGVPARDGEAAGEQDHSIHQSTRLEMESQMERIELVVDLRLSGHVALQLHFASVYFSSGRATVASHCS